MDVQNPQFEAYQARFLEVAEQAELVDPPSSLNTQKYYLCLYGENGLATPEEFELLEILAQEAGHNLKKIEIERDYWYDVILFIPAETA